MEKLTMANLKLYAADSYGDGWFSGGDAITLHILDASGDSMLEYTLPEGPLNKYGYPTYPEDVYELELDNGTYTYHYTVNGEYWLDETLCSLRYENDVELVNLSHPWQTYTLHNDIYGGYGGWTRGGDYDDPLPSGTFTIGTFAGSKFSLKA